ncbi:MAG: hypothetical protein WDN75_05760 [Bacteroidota bacterium]
MKVQWARKANFFRQRDEGQTDEDLFHERAGIYAEFGKIITIAIGKFTENEKGERCLKTKYFCNHDETLLLREFKAALEKMEPQLKLCAHNGKEFDFPYLSRRMLVNDFLIAWTFRGENPGMFHTSTRSSCGNSVIISTIPLLIYWRLSLTYPPAKAPWTGRW